MKAWRAVSEPVTTEEQLETPEQEAWRNERAVRLAVGGFATVLLTTLVFSVHLSTLGVSFGSLLYGSTTVWRGHSAAFRVSTIDPQGMLVSPVLEAELTLSDSKGERWRIRRQGRQFLDFNTPVPNDLDAHPVLAVRVTTPDGDDRFELALKVVDQPAVLPGRLRPRQAPLTRESKPHAGAYELAFYPEAGHVVAGLDNAIAARITHTSSTAPAAMLPVSLAHPPMALVSDAFGIVRFSFNPPPKARPLQFTLGAAPTPVEAAEAALKIRPSQLLVRTNPTFFVNSGQPVAVTTHSLPVRDPIHVDVWLGDALLLTTAEPPAEGVRRVDVQTPEDARGIMRIDAYRNLFDPDDTSASRILWVSNGDSDEQRAVDGALTYFAGLIDDDDDDVMAARLATSDDERRALLTLAASRFASSTPLAPLMRATLQSRTKQVDTRRERLRGQLNVLFVLTLALGMALAVAWVIRHQLRVKHAVQGVMTEGIARGEHIDPTAVHTLVRVRHMYDLLLVMAALVLVGYSIFVLLTHLSWD